MLKAIMIGMGCACLLATAAPAQEVTIGPGGVSVGRDHDRDWRRRHWERRHSGEWDRDTTGTIVERRYGGHCRTVTIRKENEDGDMVTRRIRRCD